MVSYKIVSLVKTRVQCFHNYLRSLDSGFCPNDGHQPLSTFCHFINTLLINLLDK